MQLNVFFKSWTFRFEYERLIFAYMYNVNYFAKQTDGKKK